MHVIITSQFLVLRRPGFVLTVGNPGSDPAKPLKICKLIASIVKTEKNLVYQFFYILNKTGNEFTNYNFFYWNRPWPTVNVKYDKFSVGKIMARQVAPEDVIHDRAKLAVTKLNVTT